MKHIASNAEPTDSGDDGTVPSKRFLISPLEAVLIVVGVYFVATFVGQFMVSVVPLFAGWSPQQVSTWLSSSPYAQFVYILLVDAVTVGLLIFFIRARRVSLTAFGLIRPRIRDFGVTILAYPPYFVMNAAATLAATWVFHLDINQRQQTGFENATSGMALAVTFVSLVILPPLIEEFVMRGFLFTSLKKGMDVKIAAVITSVLFAVAHLQLGNGVPALWLAALDTFILSLVLCYLRHKTGSLWAGIGLHMLKNGIAFAVLFVIH